MILKDNLQNNIIKGNQNIENIDKHQQEFDEWFKCGQKGLN